LKFGKPVAGLKVKFDLPDIFHAATAEEAVNKILSQIGKI
jgi:hypothetical protein